jgi:hypothetical protein
MAKSAFKQYKRTVREILSEDDFSKGMYCTDTPLDIGYLKYLVNFDATNEGKNLKPRRGLRTIKTALPPRKVLHTNPPVNYSYEMALLTGKVCSEPDGLEYDQFILGDITDIPLASGLYKGLLYAATVYPEGVYYEDPTTPPDSLGNQIPAYEMHLERLLGNLEVACTSFRLPIKAEIHGIKLQSPDYIAQHVGTFGFNNSYYFFRHPVEGDAVLQQTKLTPDTPEDPNSAVCYKAETVEPKALTPKEAVMWGYNMLAKNPYTFENTATEGAIQLLGLLPYDNNDNLLMTPKRNEEITLKCFYAAPTSATYQFEWEWKEPASSIWHKFAKTTLDMAELPALQTKMSFPVNEVMVRITATRDDETDPEKVLIVGFNLNPEQYHANKNVAPVNYDVTKAKGMTYWKNRLILYGLEEDNTVLLASEVNDPSYFPYPNNADIFDEAIVYAMPFLDNLLVFTIRKLYMLTLNPDGLSWTTTMIQDNLNINAWDLHLIKPVKNMVFFKSGNYYYMIVPSTAKQGGLAVAPICKPVVEAFFDNFQQNVDIIVKTLYDYDKALTLAHYYNYLDFEDIHNVYVFETEYGYLNFDMLYNVTARTWRIYLYESQHILVPFRQDVTKNGILTSIFALEQIWLDAEDVEHTSILPAIQYLQYDPAQVEDFYVPMQYSLVPEV